MKLRGIAPYLPVLLAAALGLYPIVYLVFGSFWSSSPGSPGVFTTQNYAAVASDPTLGGVLYNTLVYSLGAAALAVMAGFSLAVATQRTDAPLRRLVSYSLLLVLALPWFVEDMSWNYLLGPKVGLYNILLSRMVAVFHPGTALLGSTFFDVNTLGGMILVMGLGLTPLAYLVISPSLSLVDSSLEEASLISGAGLRETFLKIDLPLVLPAVLSACILCLVVAIEAFDAPVIIGLPGGVYVLASTVYRYAHLQAIPDYGLASAYALIMVAVTMSAIILYSRSVRASQRFVTVSGRAGAPRIFKLGRFRWPVGVGFILFILGYPVSIIGTLVFASLQSPVWAPLKPILSLSNYGAFLNVSQIGQSVGNSIFVGLTSAVATVALGTWLAYMSTRRSGRFGRGAELVASLPLAFPTVVLGVGLLWGLVFLPLPIYGTIWALTLAYTIRYVPVIARFLSGPMLQVGSELEEMSRICGAGLSRTVRKVTLPILRPAILVCAVYVLIVSIKDLGAAVLLATGGNSLFAAALFNVYGDEPLIALAGGVLFVGILAAMLLVIALVFKINLFAVIQPEEKIAPSSAAGAHGKSERE